MLEANCPCCNANLKITIEETKIDPKFKRGLQIMEALLVEYARKGRRITLQHCGQCGERKITGRTHWPLYQDGKPICFACKYLRR